MSYNPRSAGYRIGMMAAVVALVLITTLALAVVVLVSLPRREQ